MSKRKAPQDESPNSAIVDFLMELATYEKNVTREVHKYNVYRKAAAEISSHQEAITSGSEAKKLKGIGDKISKKIDEFLKTGKLEKLEKIRANENNSVISELTKINGIGPAAAVKLSNEGIKSIEDLRNNINKLTHSQQIGVKYFEDFESRIPREEMIEMQKLILKEINLIDTSYFAEICGSFRRGAETSGDIDVMITHPSFTSKDEKKGDLLHKVVDHFKEIKFITDTISMGDSKYMGVCKMKNHFRRLDIRLIPRDQYYCAMLFSTGSDLFNKNMRAHALDKGFTLNEYCLRPVGSTGLPGEPLPIASEEEIFEYIEYTFKKPNERSL